MTEDRDDPIIDALLEEVDCVVIVTDHSSYDWERIADKARLIVDTRNATAELETPKAEIIRL